MSRVDYEEMLEMANFGARIMHSRPVQLAHKYRVPLRVLSSFEDSPGTIIEPQKRYGITSCVGNYLRTR